MARSYYSNSDRWTFVVDSDSAADLGLSLLGEGWTWYSWRSAGVTYYEFIRV